MYEISPDLTSEHGLWHAPGALETKIKQNVFGSWRVMYSEKENIFDYKDFSTQEEAQEYEQKLKTK